MHPFRAAVESGDHGAVEAHLAEDVVFTSPVAFRPYEGKAMTTAILRAVVRVFEDFHYVREISDAGGHDTALVFRARVGDKEVEGCDLLHTGEDGLIDELTVMVRPLSGAQALSEAMEAEFGKIRREAEEAAAGL